MSKPITLQDYIDAGDEFWPKYWYVAKELGRDSKPEEVLKVMEALSGVVLKIRAEEAKGPMGF